MILTDVPVLESTVRLDSELNSAILAMDARKGTHSIPGYAGMDHSLWFYGFDTLFGPMLWRIQRSQADGDAWRLDEWGSMAPEFFEPYMDGAKLEDLLEVRVSHG